MKEFSPRILTELRSEKFEWFGPSPIEPVNVEEREGEQPGGADRVAGALGDQREGDPRVRADESVVADEHLSAFLFFTLEFRKNASVNGEMR